jgi:hypothetical protein
MVLVASWGLGGVRFCTGGFLVGAGAHFGGALEMGAQGAVLSGVTGWGPPSRRYFFRRAGPSKKAALVGPTPWGTLVGGLGGLGGVGLLGGVFGGVFGVFGGEGAAFGGGGFAVEAGGHFF